MDVRGYADAVARRWWLALASAVVLALLAVGATHVLAAPAYSSASAPKAEMLVTVNAVPSGGDWGEASAMLTSNIAQLATSSTVLESVRRSMDLPESLGALREQLVVEVPTRSTMIRVTSKTDGGADVVNEIVVETIRKAPSFLPHVDGEAAVVVRQVSEARDRVEAQSQSATPRESLIAALAGALLGLVVGACLAVVVEVVNVRRRDRRRLARALGIEVTVSFESQLDARGLVLLRARLLALSASESLRVAVSSVGEDRTDVPLALGLARSFAATGRTVDAILLDGNVPGGEALDGVRVVCPEGAASDAVQRLGGLSAGGSFGTADVVIIACPAAAQDPVAALLAAEPVVSLLSAEAGAGARAIEAAVDLIGELGGGVDILVDFRG